MKHIAGWFRRNNTIMAQAKDLQRQWQEMREESAAWEEGYYERDRAYNNLTLQLHRVARERDNEREQKQIAQTTNAEILDALKTCVLQIEYLHEKFQETGSGNATIAAANEAIRKHKGE